MKSRIVSRIGKKYVLPRVAKILSKPIPAKLVATGKKAAATVAAKKNKMFVIRRSSGTGAMIVAAKKQVLVKNLRAFQNQSENGHGKIKGH